VLALEILKIPTGKTCRNNEIRRFKIIF